MGERRMIVEMVDADSGESVRLAEGPMISPGEVLANDLARARRSADLAWCFAFILGLEPSPEQIAALYRVLGQKAWRRFDRTETLGRYLNVAVRREARRIRRAWEADGLLPRGEMLALDELRSRGPEEMLVRKEQQDAARELLERMRGVANARDARLLDRLLDQIDQDYTPADALRDLDLKRSAWQALQRKALRALRKKVSTKGEFAA